LNLSVCCNASMFHVCFICNYIVRFVTSTGLQPFLDVSPVQASVFQSGDDESFKLVSSTQQVSQSETILVKPAVMPIAEQMVTMTNVVHTATRLDISTLRLSPDNLIDFSGTIFEDEPISK